MHSLLGDEEGTAPATDRKLQVNAQQWGFYAAVAAGRCVPMQLPRLAVGAACHCLPLLPTTLGHLLTRRPARPPARPRRQRPSVLGLPIHDPCSRAALVFSGLNMFTDLTYTGRSPAEQHRRGVGCWQPWAAPVRAADAGRGGRNVQGPGVFALGRGVVCCTGVWYQHH